MLARRQGLQPEKRDKGRHYLKPASYNLSKEEKESMLDCLNSINVPFGGNRRAQQHHRALPARHVQAQAPGRAPNAPGHAQVQVIRGWKDAVS